MLLDKLQAFKANAIERVKVKQKLAFYGIFAALSLLVAGGFGYKISLKSKQAKAAEVLKNNVEKKIKIESGGSVLDPKEIWVSRLEDNQDRLSKQVESLEKVVTELAVSKLQDKQHNFSSSQDIQPLQEANGVKNTLNTSSLQEGSLQGNTFLQAPLEPQAPAQKQKPAMQRITFSLDPTMSKKIKKSVDHYVPSGSFVQGRLVSGVVASTAVQASANPQPVHLMLTDLGNLPRGFKADVKQCFLIGSAYGDLSSERVLMRLETLSCVERKTGEIIEIDVDGFVTGEDGANGVRGILVDRSGPAMRNAFVGGFLSGMGDFFGKQQTSVPTVIGAGGVASFNPLNAQRMLEGGAGKGVGNAMEKLSDFYIKRAEQLQPVLEIEPGRLIHVVFKKGFDMNQTLYRQSLMNANDSGRREVAGRATSQSTGEDQ